MAHVGVGQIILSDQEAASNTNILNGTRLQTVPAGGYLTFELQASDNDATNNFTVTIQMPGGDTPIDAVRMPTGGSTGLTGVLDEREKFQWTGPVGQGGHCVFSCVEAGTAELTWRITYTPA